MALPAPRSGVLARKTGHDAQYSMKDGRPRFPWTVLSLDGCQVVGVAHGRRARCPPPRRGGEVTRTDGYKGCHPWVPATRRPKRTNKALRGQFAKAGGRAESQAQGISAYRVTCPEIGAEVVADHFVPGPEGSMCPATRSARVLPAP